MPHYSWYNAEVRLLIWPSLEVDMVLQHQLANHGLDGNSSELLAKVFWYGKQCNIDFVEF